MGPALLSQGRHAEAEPLIVDDCEGMKAREVRRPVTQRIRLQEPAEQVVRLYEEWGRPEKVADRKAKLEMPDLPADVVAPHNSQ